MRMSNNVFFLNTILLGGSSTEAKLSAAKAAGFDQVELWRQDVEAAGGDTKAIVAILKRLGLGLTDYQVLLDFDGAPDAIREGKRAEALRMMDTAVAVGANTLLTPACTRKDCVADRIEEDLRWLAKEAAQRGLRVAYEAMAWSTFNHYTPDAWQTLKNVGEKNLGMVIDAFHIFVRHRTATDLEGIPAERIFLVQLSDLNHDLTRDTVVDTARHHRLLPGQGTFPLDTILQALRAKSYAGPIGLEVFNDDLKAQGPNQAARSAMTAFQSVLSKSMATNKPSQIA